jgi:hypothetical protein
MTIGLPLGGDLGMNLSVQSALDQRVTETPGEHSRIDWRRREHFRRAVVMIIATLVTLAIAGTSTVGGYWQARRYTLNKLRYVDAVHKAVVPVVAGVGAALVATPVVWLLPLVGTGTALLFGGGVAMGVAAGARDIRKRIGAG